MPGSTYYLGVQNTNSFTVNYGIEVDFHLIRPTNAAADNTVPISSIIYTNRRTNGFLLTWFAPSNDLFQVQWTTASCRSTWQTFTNPPSVSYNTNFPPARRTRSSTSLMMVRRPAASWSDAYYQLILLGSGAGEHVTGAAGADDAHGRSAESADCDEHGDGCGLPPQTLTYSSVEHRDGHEYAGHQHQWHHHLDAGLCPRPARATRSRPL